MIITKQRSPNASSWAVWHKNLAASRYLYMDSNNSPTETWNWITPSASYFQVESDGATWATINQDGCSFLSYLWAEVPGFSKFGAYTGNGLSDGPFVYCGFKPRWVMLKRTDSSGNWLLWDTSRGPVNVDNAVLYPNLGNAEYSTGTVWAIDILSNGFKLRSDTGTTDANGSGGTFIYAAFAEAPFKYATAR
jgi:hypothetical protein